MEWPGQAVQVAILIYFAALVESGIKRGTLAAREVEYDAIVSFIYNLCNTVQYIQ